MSSQPTPRLLLLLDSHSVDGQLGLLLKSVDPVKEGEGRLMTVLAAQERPSLADQLLTVWVIATIVFVASIVSDLPPGTWPRRLVLLLPSLWLLSAWIDNSADTTNGERAAFVLTLVVTVIAMPFVAWILVTAINTDFVELPSKNKAAVIAAVGIFVIIGFGIGARNDLLLNCDDFKISGNDLPENCVQVTPRR